MFGRRRFGRRLLFFGLAPLLALGALAVPVFAWSGAGMHGGWGRCGHGPESAEDVVAHMKVMADQMKSVAGVDEVQGAAIDAIVADAAPRMAAFRTEGETLREDLHAALSADDIDENEVERLRRDGIDLANRASKEGLDAVLQVRAILTPEQRATVRDLVQRFHGSDRW